MERIDKVTYGLCVALTASMRSEDQFLKVGVAIENYEGRIIAIGYNGLKSGFNLDPEIAKDREKRLDYFVHSEANALSLIKKGEGKVLYSTLSPCADCAKNIVAHGIEKVFYLTKYHRCSKFEEIFKAYGIEVKQIEMEKIKKALSSFLE